MFQHPFLYAAIALALYTAWALNVAASLRHYGAWTLLGCAILLGGHAAGLVSRRPIAWAFAIAFLLLTGAGYVYFGARLVYGGITERGSAGWAALANLIAIPYGAGILAVGVVSVLLARALKRAEGGLAVPLDFRAWLFAVAGGLLSLAELGWLVGHQYHHRLLPEQNACVGGNVLACANLSYQAKVFGVDERRAFALRGCERDHLDSCGQLSRLLGPGQGSGSAEVVAVAAQCDKGMNTICKTLSAHLLSMGDVKGAARHLVASCERTPAMCSSSAETLEQAGLPELSRQALSTGCKGQDARSCRGLLKLADLPEEERVRLEFRACLVGDSGDCWRAMKRDFRSTCDRFCALSTATYPCLLCAREAAKRRDETLARGWLETTCERGFAPACKELGTKAPSVPRAPPPPGG